MYCRLATAVLRSNANNIMGSAVRHSSSVQSFSVSYKEHGDPQKVLAGKTSEIAEPNADSDEILVQMLAAPIHPADINMIQGIYPILPSLPAIGGYEGVGKVVQIGKRVGQLQVGDWVVPYFLTGWGTWKTYGVCSEKDVLKLPNDIPLTSAATLMVNPGTAYRMLHDFVHLSAGDVVIQNGANSSVGQAAIQIAASMGLHTVNIVRDRPDFAELKASLEKFGATHVITDAFVRSAEMKPFMKSLPPPKLALNCVSGKSVAELLKYIERGGTLVTYGGMSRMPLLVPTGSLIFNDAKLRGFWMTQWNRENATADERQKMVENLSAMVKTGQLQPPLCQTVPLRDFQDAIEKTMLSFTTQKQILVMDG